MKLCGKCGAANDEANSQCTICGAKLYQPGQIKGNTSRDNQQCINDKKSKAEKNKKREKAIIAAIVLVCIVVAVLSVVIPYYKNDNQGKGSIKVADPPAAKAQVPEVDAPVATPSAVSDYVSEQQDKPQNDYDNGTSETGTFDNAVPVASNVQSSIMLYEMVPINTSDGTPGFIFYSEGHDNEGEWYSNSIGGYLADTTNWCEYQIDGLFKTISGVVYLNYDFRNEKANYAKLTVYGDNKMLFTSSIITAGLTPQHFSIDIEGVQVLRVCIYGNDYVRVSECLLSPLETATSAPQPATPSFVEYSGSMSSYHSIRASTAAASSEIHYQGKIYRAANAIDGDLTSSWQEDADDDGIGEYLIVYYDQIESVDLIRLRLGSSGYYKENGRPKTLLFEFSDGSQSQYSFPDINKDYYLQLTSTVKTNYIKMTIMDVYPGEKWSDTCISEVTAFQKPG